MRKLSKMQYVEVALTGLKQQVRWLLSKGVPGASILLAVTSVLGEERE